jgi:hypothetical protein
MVYSDPVGKTRGSFGAYLGALLAVAGIGPGSMGYHTPKVLGSCGHRTAQPNFVK